MRIILLLFILIFSQHPRYLKGDYFETEHGMVGARWHFEKDGTFTYSEANCTGGRSGNGIYKFDDDSVHFIFQASATAERISRLEAFDQKTGTTGWMLNVQCRDEENGEDFPFALIEVKDAAGNRLAGAVADIDGKAMLKIPDYKDAISISVHSPGYSKAALKLQKAGTYSIKATMTNNFGPSVVQEGTQYDYLLLSSDKKGMKWQISTTQPDTTIIIDVKRIKE